MVADAEMVVVFFDASGTQQGPWPFVQDPTARPIATSLTLAFRFDDAGQIVDQWLGSNFVDPRSTRLGIRACGPARAGTRLIARPAACACRRRHEGRGRSDALDSAFCTPSDG
ncbi:MAG: hypothetical protein ACRD2W_21855 [Acidimicrobiales bacterium]